MFDDLTDGRVEKGTPQFEKLKLEAKFHLDEISRIPGKRLRQRLGRHVAWLDLNERLSDFGWAIKRNGKMFEVRVSGEPITPAILEKPRPAHGSIEDINQRALAHFTNTGQVMDPRDGRVLLLSERHRFGIS